MSKKIAVTGSAGFIGGHLLLYLKKKGYDVIEISRTQNIDISNWEDVKDIPKFDVIVHLAAKSFVPHSFKYPKDFYYFNQTSTLNVLELSRKHKAEVIFLSSYLYGKPQQLPIPEHHSLNPHNPYAQSKIICEKLCQGYHRDFDIPITIFRPFNIYGPQQKEPFLIPTIIEQSKRGSILLKDPRPKRDYIHIGDVISAIIQVIDKGSVGFDIFNLGTGISHSVEEVVSFISGHSKNNIEVKYKHEYRQGEVLDTIADISRVKKNLSWQPEITLEAGIKGMLDEI